MRLYINIKIRLQPERNSLDQITIVSSHTTIVKSSDHKPKNNYIDSDAIQKQTKCPPKQFSKDPYNYQA